jgi:hypothetical protein
MIRRDSSEWNVPVEERRAAAVAYEAAGRGDKTAELTAEADALTAHLGG